MPIRNAEEPEFLSHGYDVGINFENKAGDMDCHILNYKLSPYLTKNGSVASVV